MSESSTRNWDVLLLGGAAGTGKTSVSYRLARILERTLEVARVLAPGVRAVIDNHLGERTPVVLEGDFLLPEGLIADSSRVRAVFLYEADERQIVENFLRREPEAGPQTKRAHVSWLYGQWLKNEAEARGLPALPARPWETIFERVLAAL